MVSITRIQKNPKDAGIFFDVLFESADIGAVLVPGWKLTDGRIEPPTKRSGASYYKTVFIPPQTALLVQDALMRLNIPQVNAELNSTSWVTAKWGKTSLSYATDSPERAAELYERYHEQVGPVLLPSQSEIKDLRALRWAEEHG